jgi:hypothetical protein
MEAGWVTVLLLNKVKQPQPEINFRIQRDQVTRAKCLYVISTEACMF